MYPPDISNNLYSNDLLEVVDDIIIELISISQYKHTVKGKWNQGDEKSLRSKLDWDLPPKSVITYVYNYVTYSLKFIIDTHEFGFQAMAIKGLYRRDITKFKLLSQIGDDYDDCLILKLSTIQACISYDISDSNIIIYRRKLSGYSTGEFEYNDTIDSLNISTPYVLPGSNFSFDDIVIGAELSYQEKSLLCYIYKIPMKIQRLEPSSNKITIEYKILDTEELLEIILPIKSCSIGRRKIPYTYEFLLITTLYKNTISKIKNFIYSQDY